MARKPTAAPSNATITVEQARSGLSKLMRRLKEYKEFLSKELSKPAREALDELYPVASQTLTDVFGDGTIQRKNFNFSAFTYFVPLSMSHGTSEREHREGYEQGLAFAISKLNGAIKYLQEIIDDGDEEPVAAILKTPESMPRTNDIFVVHGRDDASKTEVARFLERAGFNAVILHEQANSGQMIFEKFEKHASAAGFAVVVVTPDDVGSLKGEELRPRARQNVIGEMFWFAGSLGRKNVCVLMKGEIEMPSDVAGIGYTDMDSRGAWRMELCRELQAAGYTVDWSKALA